MRMLLYIVFTMLMCTLARGQQQIPNGGLEDWTLVPGSGTFKDYEEPNDGWTSGNGVIHVAPGTDPVCEKTTDAHGGQYAAKLTTRLIFGQIASGSLFLGKFALNFANPASSAQRGIPFSGPQPTRFRCYYRYLPSGNDSAEIYAMFTRWDGTTRQYVAASRTTIYAAQAEWAEIDVEIPSFQTVPDSMSVVAASSAGGENFKGNVGSTLWVDDFAFTWGTSDVEETTANPQIVVNGSTAIVLASSSIRSVYAIDLCGRSRELGPISVDGRVDLTSCSPGIWFILARDDRNNVIAQSGGVYLR